MSNTARLAAIPGLQTAAEGVVILDRPGAGGFDLEITGIRVIVIDSTAANAEVDAARQAFLSASARAHQEFGEAFRRLA